MYTNIKHKMVNLRVLPLGVLLFVNLYARTCNAKALISDNSIDKRLINVTLEEDIPACQIYCTGPLLHTVQMAHLFSDSKHFVDMKLKYSPEQTLTEFNELMASTNQNPSNDDVRSFVNSHFDEPGKEFSPWTPDDWTENPKFLAEIKDPDLKQWGADLNEIWKELGRKMIDDVHEKPEYYSIIPVKNAVIVPGGRFIEFYYWDSYWVVRGLLYSEMYKTARGMLENFLSIVQRFGFIPNGGRIYYLGRSQPPLLTAMVKSYVEFTKDTQFAIDSLPVLEHEFEYWMNNHIVQVKGHNMAAYRDTSTGPRPESYREDVESSGSFKTNEDKESHYSELKASCESGMDFSSRWFIDENGLATGNLTNLKTRSIVPVELNAILHWNAKLLAEFHTLAGNDAKAKEYEDKASKILEGIQAVLWNEEVGVWLDYDTINNKPRNFFVPSNFAPLWTKAFNSADLPKLSTSVLKYVNKLELDKYPGGVPNTFNKTGEQWDFPNVWPPMQYIITEGIRDLDTPEAKQLASKWTHRWVKSNFEAYRDARAMFEKYNAEKFGGHGGGGEYGVQKGFGWTNGVIVEYLAKYGGEISLSNSANTSVSTSKLLSYLGIATVAVLATLMGRIIW